MLCQACHVHASICGVSSHAKLVEQECRIPLNERSADSSIPLPSLLRWYQEARKESKQAALQYKGTDDPSVDDLHVTFSTSCKLSI